MSSNKVIKVSVKGKIFDDDIEVLAIRENGDIYHGRMWASRDPASSDRVFDWEKLKRVPDEES